MIRSYRGKLTLGKLSRGVGLARTSVLYYESLGLLSPSERSAAGYRLYGTAEVERLQAIRRLRDAGLALADIRVLLEPSGASAASRGQTPSDLLQERLVSLCQEVERIREQQRLIAKLLAVSDDRHGRQHWDKTVWVALLRRAGFDDEAMRRWHVEFERENPKAHATFLKSLGLKPSEVAGIRRWSNRHDEH